MASWKDIENMVAERGVDDEVFFKVCYLVSKATLLHPKLQWNNESIVVDLAV